MKKNDQQCEWIKRTDKMVVASPSDLHIGTVYYYVSDANSKLVTPQTVRPRIKRQSQYGRDETEEEYNNYKEFLYSIIRKKQCLIIKK